MTTLINDGTTTLTPTVVDGYESVREAQNIVHPVLGRSAPDVTLRPAALRSGTLQLVFAGGASESDSQTAETVHAQGTVFTLVSDDRGTIEMTYVTAGRITRTLHDETRDAWIVSVDFQEV